jgi:hypothetical protein
MGKRYIIIVGGNMKIQFVQHDSDDWSVIYRDHHANIEYRFPDFEKATQFVLEMSKQFGLPY